MMGLISPNGFVVPAPRPLTLNGQGRSRITYQSRLWLALRPGSADTRNHLTLATARLSELAV